MTPRQEADDAVRQFAAQIAASGQETTGIPRPATVESSETVLDPESFALELDPQTYAQSFPGGRPGTGIPPGACCIAGVCSIKYAAACATAGGTYLGDGVPCPPSSVSLVCDSISASLNKCGYGEFCDTSSPPKIYLNYSLSRSGSIDQEESSDCPVPGAAFTDSITTDVSQSITKHYDISDPAHCSEVTDTNTGSSHFLHVFNGTTESSCSNSTGIGCWTPVNCGGGDCGSDNTTCAPTSKVRTIVYCSNTTNIFYCNVEHTHPAICSSTGSDVTTETLSSEYTTDMLIANVEGALPSYPGTFMGSCSASRDLSDDETSYTIRRFKPKFKIPAALDDDLLICYNEHFVPDDGGDPVDTPQTVTIPGGDTEVEGDEVMEPGTDGEITITDITTCCTG